MPQDDKKYGDYEGTVKRFKQLLEDNNKAKLLSNCQCSVDVPNNFKQWTEAHLNVIATDKFGVEMFDRLAFLADKSVQVIKDAKGVPVDYTKDAYNAQAALADLAPAGMAWDAFQERIANVYAKNSQAIFRARQDIKIWGINTVDDYLTRIANAGRGVKELHPTLLNVYAKNAEFRDLFEQIYDVASMAKEKNKTGFYTESAQRAQQFLTKYADSGNWQALYNSIVEIDKQTRQYRKAQSFLNGAPRTGAVDFQGLNLHGVTISEEKFGYNDIDQQAALELLGKHGVTTGQTPESAADHGLVMQFKKQVKSQAIAA